MLHVSVDGVEFLLIADTLVGTYNQSDFREDVRFTKLDLPNGACFRYIKIKDKSDPDCVAADGFDLWAVVVVDPCCPPQVEPLVFQTPTVPNNLIVISGTAAFGTAVGATALVGLIGLTVLSVNAQRRERRMSESSILEPKEVNPAQLELMSEKNAKETSNDVVVNPAEKAL